MTALSQTPDSFADLSLLAPEALEGWSPWPIRRCRCAS